MTKRLLGLPLLLGLLLGWLSPAVRGQDLTTSLSFFLRDLADQTVGVRAPVATYTATNDGLGTTSTNGVLIRNTTAATAGTPVQLSPRTHWSGTGWDTDDTVSRSARFIAEGLPASAAAVTGTWRLGWLDPVTDAITYPLTVTSGGVLTTESLKSNAGVEAGAANPFFWTGRSEMRSPDDGQITLFNAANNNFTRLNFGGTTSLFSAWTRSTTGLRQHLADGTAGGFLATSGLFINDVDARTIADNAVGASPATLTLTPTASYVEITCNDPDTCDITMGETGIVEGTVVTIVNVSANVVDFADTVGVSEIAGAFAAGQFDAITLRYTGAEWVETVRSNN